MMGDITLDTRVIDLTVGELMNVIKQQYISMGVKQPKEERVEPIREDRNFVCGMTAFADLLGVSLSTANVYKDSGKFDEAISQSGKGRRVIIDVDKALEIHRKLKGKE